MTGTHFVFLGFAAPNHLFEICHTFWNIFCSNRKYRDKKNVEEPKCLPVVDRTFLSQYPCLLNMIAPPLSLPRQTRCRDTKVSGAIIQIFPIKRCLSGSECPLSEMSAVFQFIRTLSLSHCRPLNCPLLNVSHHMTI